jgi:hypothetical protein
MDATGDDSGREALRRALADRRRHATVLALVALALAVALLVDTPSTRYGAGLVVFAVWMGCFVLTCVAFIECAGF